MNTVFCSEYMLRGKILLACRLNDLSLGGRYGVPPIP
jgi:hypothetical protein